MTDLFEFVNSQKTSSILNNISALAIENLKIFDGDKMLKRSEDYYINIVILVESSNKALEINFLKKPVNPVVLAVVWKNIEPASKDKLLEIARLKEFKEATSAAISSIKGYHLFLDKQFGAVLKEEINALAKS